MSDTDVPEPEDAEDAEAPEDLGKKKRLSGKKLILFIFVPLILVLLGGGVGAFFLLSGSDGKSEASAHVEGGDDKGDEHGVGANKIIFHELAEILVSLNTGGKQASYLKITFVLELENAFAVAGLKNIMPRVLQNYQAYLREMKLNDLKGSVGLLRLREELLIRMQRGAGAIKIKDVLVKEMLVQ